MPELENPSFTPTEIWTPTSETAELDLPIQDALRAMNQQNPSALIHGLQKNIEHSERGVAYAVLKGENPSEYSETDALVTFNPFASALTPNMLVRAEFIRQVAKFSNVTDAAGKLKPVVILASPGLAGSSLKLSREERHEVKSGELGPVAKELLRAVGEKNIGRVTLLGFSQGADVALAGGRKAYSANLDTHAIAVGDPAGVEARGMAGLAGDFFKAGSGELKKSIVATGLDAQKKALGMGVIDFARFGISATTPLNLALYRGLGANSFESRVQEILGEGRVGKLVIGYGSDGAIATPDKIEPAMGRLYEENGPDSFISIRVDGATHAWGDQLTLLAKLYMQAAA